MCPSRITKKNSYRFIYRPPSFHNARLYNFACTSSLFPRFSTRARRNNFANSFDKIEKLFERNGISLVCTLPIPSPSEGRRISSANKKVADIPIANNFRIGPMDNSPLASLLLRYSIPSNTFLHRLFIRSKRGRGK